MEADGIIRPGKTTKGLRRQSAVADQQKEEFESEDTQLDEPSADVEGKNDKASSKKSPENILAGKCYLESASDCSVIKHVHWFKIVGVVSSQTIIQGIINVLTNLAAFLLHKAAFLHSVH